MDDEFERGEGGASEEAVEALGGEGTEDLLGDDLILGETDDSEPAYDNHDEGDEE